ncbi:hypothetical protein G6F35_007150 [Rhizopus arrhizus]|nr:hypothetical protein G6F35_007150 [Rhizopus arrhizus]
MCHYSETTNPKDGAEIQNLIYTNTDYFSLFSECGSYGSDKFFSNSPTLESYSTDTTSSSPILPNEDHFFKSNEINVMENELSLFDENITDSNLFQIRVLGVPKEGAKSRVETQIKLCIQLLTRQAEKVTQWSFVRISKNMLVKSKIRKAEQKPRQSSLSSMVEFSDESKILNLEAKVVRSDTNQPVRMCEGCVRRERKRAERIKDGKSKTVEQDIEKEKERILLFNSDSLINFATGEITLPSRITCYCRHHNEKVGFRICFALKDDKDKTVATGISPPILITDDHKNPKNKINYFNGKKRSRESDDTIPTIPNKRHSISIPNDSYLNQLTPLQTPPTTEKQEDHINIPHWDPIFSDALPTPPALSDTAEHLPSNHLHDHSPLLFTSLSQTRPPPRLDRIVPAQGPTYGGTEVTLLGSGFYQGLTCLFGDRSATITTVYPNSMVCLLPPATHAGPVVVSFKEYSLVLEGQDIVIFTYYDASDQALLELALQLIGLKMTGKLQNAKHIAMEIVRGDFCHQQQKQQKQQQQQMIHDILKTNLLDFQTLSQTNENKHNLLHLATLVGNKELVDTLLSSVTETQDRLQFLNAQDRNGMTPLHFACQLNSVEIVQSLLLAGTNPSIQSTLGRG